MDDEQNARDQENVHDELAMPSSHLLCHADNGGYYVPVDISEPLFLPEEDEVLGYGMVGSSQRLQSELVWLAPGIDIHPDEDGTLSSAEQAKLVDIPRTDPSNPRSSPGPSSLQHAGRASPAAMPSSSAEGTVEGGA
ncbi:hypothetical protein GCM10009730_54720 [Streptomyces albidochromogenes]